MSRWSDCLTKKYQTRGKGTKDKPKKDPKPNKYHAVRTAAGFPSHLEERVYAELLYLQKAKLLKEVSRYPTFHIADLHWKCDFKAWDVTLKQWVAIEAKGLEDGRFTAIRQVWPAVGPCRMRIYEDAGGGRLKNRDIEGLRIDDSPILELT